MEFKTPNFLYPLATARQIQWTRDTIRGEKSVKKPFIPKRDNVVKKNIVKSIVRDKKMSLRFGRPVKTRNTSNPMMKATLPKDPMRNLDPRPGNAMHIANTLKDYYGYQK